MAYEVITTFTEVDPGNDFVQTATKNDVTTLKASLKSYVYKDYGVDNFGDFRHFLEAKITQDGGNTKCGIWALSNDIGSSTDYTNGLELSFYNAGAGGIEFWLEDNGNSNQDFSRPVFASLDTLYYFDIERSGTTTTVKIYTNATDRLNEVNNIVTLSITCVTTTYRYAYVAFNHDSNIFVYRSWYTENLEFSPSVPETETKEEIVTLSDEIEINISSENVELEDIITLSDEIATGFDDDVTITDEIIVGYSELRDLENDFRSVKLENYDVDNKFNTVIEVISNIGNKIRSAILSLSHVDNKINSVLENVGTFRNWLSFGSLNLDNLINDIRTQKLVKNNIANDFRMLSTFQIAGDAGFQSLGKDYVKVYIDSVEQTDVDIDSMTVKQVVNSASEASFDLGRPFDNTKPDMEALVEIKYHTRIIYKGYVVTINPTDSPESIKVDCKDKYWKDNQDNKYFFVGHAPADNIETYYSTPSEALNSEFSYNPVIGDFVPETINCYGKPSADCVTELITSSGNMGWYYDENHVRQLWVAGEGSIIGLEAQEIDKNMGLHQVVKHNITESVEGLINKYKVQMGDSVIRRYKTNIQTSTDPNAPPVYNWVIFHFSGWHYENIEIVATPDWDSSLEVLAYRNGGFGWDFPDPNKPNEYANVYQRYKLPNLNAKYASWSDRYSPGVFFSNVSWTTSTYGTWADGKLRTGFTIDYLDGILTFNDKVYVYELGQGNKITKTHAPRVTLKLWKKLYTAPLSYAGQNPEENPDPGLITEPDDHSYRTQFVTDKVGDYSDTIVSFLRLSNLNIQDGTSYKDENGNWVYIPSWDDKPFAEDMAYWELSKTADKKVSGDISVTIDCALFHGIKLSSRLKVDGIFDNSLNIVSITYNFSDFTANINVKNGRYYKRTVSFPTHGE